MIVQTIHEGRQRAIRSKEILKKLLGLGWEDSEALKNNLANSFSRWALQGKLERRGRGLYRLTSGEVEALEDDAEHADGKIDPRVPTQTAERARRANRGVILVFIRLMRRLLASEHPRKLEARPHLLSLLATRLDFFVARRDLRGVLDCLTTLDRVEPVSGGTSTARWAVELLAGADADAIAASVGLTNDGQTDSFGNFFMFDGPSPDPVYTKRLEHADGVLGVNQQILRQTVLLGVEDSFTDPQFSLQWHLENTAQRTDTDRMVPGEDANVLEAWNLEFPSTVYDGAGVLIAIVDNGLWHQHVDLAPNYEPSASIDLVDGDLDPSPSVPVSEPGLGIHGSTMASIAAASHSTGPSVPGDCGVGVAFGSRLSGIRMIGGALSGATNPELLRAALLHANSQVDIYSNSWGADDQTPDLYTLSTMEESALNNGTANGRNGKGSIYVFAGGNGMPKDNTNASGFPASRFTIAVTGTSYDGKKNLFTEPGSSLMLNAPTGGEKLRDALVTSTGRPDGLIDTCSSNGEDGYGVHSSAATAVVSGVIALMLQANPELSWRSVQQILARTAEKNDPNHPEWCSNSAGFHVHDDYGFGRVDAGAAVRAALDDDWFNPPFSGAQQIYERLPSVLIGGGSFPTAYIPHFNPTDPSDPSVPQDPVCQSTPEDFCGDGSLVFCDSISITSGDFGLSDFIIEQAEVVLDLEIVVPGLPAAAIPGLKGYPCIDDDACHSGAICEDFVCCSETNPSDCEPEAAPGTFGGRCLTGEACGSIEYPDLTTEPLFCNGSNLCDLKRLYRRGDLEITLLSPSGTVSRVMYGRGRYDSGEATPDDPNRFYDFHPMMTVRHWGESADGEWTLRIKDTTQNLPSNALDRDFGFIFSWTLNLYGYDRV